MEELTERECEELALMLRTSVMQKAFAIVEAHADDKIRHLGMADLTSDAERFKTIKGQGVVIGMRLAIDTLIELAKKEN